MKVNLNPIKEYVSRYRESRNNIFVDIPFPSVYKLKTDNSDYSAIYDEYHKEEFLTAVDGYRFFPRDLVYSVSSHLGWVYNIMDYVDVMYLENLNPVFYETRDNIPLLTNYYSVFYSEPVGKNVQILRIDNSNVLPQPFITYNAFSLSEEQLSFLTDEDIARLLAVRFTNNMHFAVLSTLFGIYPTAVSLNFTGAPAPISVQDYIRAGVMALSLMRTDETKHYVAIMPNILYYIYTTIKQRSRDEVYEFEKYLKVMPVGLPLGFNMPFNLPGNELFFLMNDSVKIGVSNLRIGISHSAENNRNVFLIEAHFSFFSNNKGIDIHPSISSGIHYRAFRISTTGYTP